MAAGGPGGHDRRLRAQPQARMPASGPGPSWGSCAAPSWGHLVGAHGAASHLSVTSRWADRFSPAGVPGFDDNILVVTN